MPISQQNVPELRLEAGNVCANPEQRVRLLLKRSENLQRLRVALADNYLLLVAVA